MNIVTPIVKEKPYYFSTELEALILYTSFVLGLLKPLLAEPLLKPYTGLGF